MNRYRVSRYLSKQRKRHLMDFPQVACFAFDSISSQIMIDGKYEAGILAFLHNHVFPKMKRRRLCLDVGANIGNHSLSFSKDFERVYSFEPNARVFRLLRLNAELAPNISVFETGASDGKQELPAYVWPSNLGGATVEAAHAEKTLKRGQPLMQTFKLDRLDDILNPKDALEVDFLKIDVEGHELKALRGAERLLTTARPVIAFEMLKSGIIDGRSEVVELLKNFGYNEFHDISVSLGMGRRLDRLATKTLPDALVDRLTKITMKRVEKLENKNYPLLLAGCGNFMD